MRRVFMIVFLLSLLPACHFGSKQSARKEGWSDELVKLATDDCLRLWSSRGVESEKIVPLCTCVTDGFSTSFSTVELAHQKPEQKFKATQIAVDCVKSVGVDLARLQRPRAAGIQR